MSCTRLRWRDSLLFIPAKVQDLQNFADYLDVVYHEERGPLLQADIFIRFGSSKRGWPKILEERNDSFKQSVVEQALHHTLEILD